MKLLRTSLISLAALPIFAIAAGAAKSGPSIGAMVSPFEPTHVTGADAGTKTCPICKYGRLPAVQVWVNSDSMANIAKIADTLEGAVKMEGSDKLKAFIIFIKPASMSDKQESSKLKMIADKCHLVNVALAYVMGPKAEPVSKYKINTSSHVKNTVIVYHDLKVSANFVNFKADDAGIMSLKGAMMKACGM